MRSKRRVQPKLVKPQYQLLVAGAVMRPPAERKPRDQLEVHGQQEQRGRRELHVGFMVVVMPGLVRIKS